MRVALISDIPDERPFSGPQRTTKGIAEALEKNGVDVTVIGYRGNPSIIDCSAKILSNDIDSFNLSLLKFQRDVLQWVSQRDFDIVHTWEPLVPQPFVDESIDIFSVHGVAFLEEAALSPTLSERAAAAFHTFQAVVTSISTYTVAQSSRTSEDAKKCGVSVDDIVPVGIDERFLQPDSSEDGRVLYISRINSHKNQRELVKVAIEDELDLHLAGSIANRDYARSIPSFDRYYIGRISEAALLREYAAADIYVLPSKHEGFGLTALEAMAAGTPVVVSDECGIRDVIEPGENGYVYEQGNTRDLSACIAKCFSNRSELAGGARRTAERLTWTEISEAYIETYNSVTQ